MTDEPVLSDFGGDIEQLASALTPNLGLPYPSSSDPVAAGATNIHDLAAAIDASAKLVGPATAVLVAATARRPTYDREIVILQFTSTAWGILDNYYVLALGSMGSGYWYLLGPLELPLGAAADIGLGVAVTVTDPGVIIHLPRQIIGDCWAQFNMNASTEGYIFNGASAGSVFTSSGLNVHQTNLYAPPNLWATSASLGYFAGSGSIVSNRWLKLRVNALIGV